MIENEQREQSINIYDVANYIISKIKYPLTHMKLHKLIYYSYARYLVENHKKPLFKEPLQAWLFGPVFTSLYPKFKKFQAKPITKQNLLKEGNMDKIDPSVKNIIDSVLEKYGNFTREELSDKTHQESPYINSYIHYDWSENVISDDEIYNFFKNER